MYAYIYIYIYTYYVCVYIYIYIHVVENDLRDKVLVSLHAALRAAAAAVDHAQEGAGAAQGGWHRAELLGTHSMYSM